MAPRIDRKNLKNISYREGQPILFDVKISGEPVPSVSWTINDKSIMITSHRRIENVPYNSKFFNENPERKDSGVYKITAVNKYGTDSVEVDVEIICKHIHIFIVNKVDING